MEKKINFCVIKGGACLTCFDDEFEAETYVRKSGGYVERQEINSDN